MHEQTEPIKIIFKKIDNEANLTQINTAHPFDRSEFLEFLQAEFPDFVAQIQTATRPEQSQHADELEKWECNWILKRKDVITGETQGQYLIRLLYEEFFSVNQNPGQDNPPSLKGSCGITPGGLISHFYFPHTTGNESIVTAAKLPFKGKTLKEGMLSLMTTNNWEQRKKALALGTIANECTYTDANSYSNYFRSTRDGIFNRIIQNEDVNYAEDMDTFGYRLIAMLKSEPEMVEPVTDQELLSKFGFQRTNMSKAEFLVYLWEYFGKVIFHQGGFYRSIKVPEVKEALEELLYLRTHPKLQIFFKYLSPSGYMNDWLNQDNSQAGERTLNT